MKGRILYSCLFVGFCLIGLSYRSVAQTVMPTITSVSTTVAATCPGNTLAVTFTTSGTYAAGTIFTAYLSNATGSVTPGTIVGSISRPTASSGTVTNVITATIPASTAEGTGYRVGVAVGTGVKTISGNTVTIGRPAAPAVTNPAPYCEGATAQSLLPNATASKGGVLRWYALNGTSSSTPTTPNTNLIGNTDYLVSQVVDGCESPTVAIVVTVKDTPNAPGTSSLSYCVGQPAGSLNATPVRGASLNWYTVASGGTPSPIAPIPSTTASGSTTYYVSQMLNGCEGPRASLVVTVNGIPAAPAAVSPPPYCEGASAAALTATGQNLRWYGTNSTGGTGLAVATVPNTSITGPTTYYVSQTVNGCESTTRTGIIVTVNGKPTVPGTTTAPPYCQNQTAAALAATPATGGTLNWYGASQTGGTASAVATVPNTSQPGTILYYVSQTVSGCESSRVAISVTVKPSPAAPGVVSQLIACQNRPGYALTATPAAGATLNWYGTSANGGTATPTPPALSTNTLGSTVYYVSQTLNGCEGARASITVVVNPIPALPGTPPVPPYCEGATAVPLVAGGQGLRWYGTNQTGSSFSTNAPTPSTATNAIGTTTYYLTQSVNGCESERAGVPVQVKPTPKPPAVQDASFCQNTPAVSLTATASPNAVLNWYGENSSGGTRTDNPPTVPSMAAKTYYYYVSQTLDGCESGLGSSSGRAQIAVRVKPAPNAPGVSPLIFCAGRPAQPLTAAGTNLKWYDAANKPITGVPTPSTTSPGVQVFNVSQTSGEGCESATASLTVTVNTIPSLPTVTAAGPYCEGQTATALQANGTSLKWYGTNQTGGSPSGNAPVPGTATNAIGTTTYYLTQTVNGCESERTGIAVRVKDTPDKPIVQNASFCQFYPATTLGATAVPNAKLNWYGESLSGGTRTDNPPTVPNNLDKTYYYFVSQTLDGCESGLGNPSGRAQIAVRVKPTPGVPGVTNIALCNNEPASPLQAAGSNLKWYTNQDSPIQGIPTPNTGSVGDQIYKVTQTSDGCESVQKATLVVTIKPLPGAPGVRDVNYCQIQQDQPPQNVASLAGNADGQNLRWFSASGNEISAPTPSIDRAGLQTYQVSQTVNGCQGGRATVQVAVNTLPAPATPKPLVTYCVNQKPSPLEASGAAGSQFRWIDPYGRVTNDAPTPPTINTNIDPKGDAYFVYQIGTNSCYSPRATLRVIVTSPPTLGLVAPVASVNLGQKAPLQLKFTSTGPYSYSLTGGYMGTSRSADTTISVLPRGNTIYQVETVSNGCGVGLPGNPATAQITVRVPTVSTSALAATTLCAGTALTVPFTTSGQFNPGNAFRVELISLTDTTQKYPVQTISSGSPITGPLPVTLAAGQYYVRVKADNPEIAIIGTNSPSVLTVRTLANASLAGTQTIYEGIPASLTFTFGGSGPWTAVYADSLTSYSVAATVSPYVVDARPTRTTTYRLVSVTNNCGTGPVSGTAIVTVAPLLGVEDNPLDPLVKTYPVPTQTVLVVDMDLPLTQNPAVLSLTNASGKPVLQRTTRSQRNELDLTNQPSGLYLLRIQVGDRQTVRKVMKN